MKRNVVVDLLLIGVIIIFIGVLVYAITIYEADALSCLSNPINYIEHLNNLSCNCQEYKPYLDIDSINLSQLYTRYSTP